MPAVEAAARAFHFSGKSGLDGRKWSCRIPLVLFLSRTVRRAPVSPVMRYLREVSELVVV